MIAYSRRGHYGSSGGAADDPGCASEDLDAFADHLGLDRFHLLGTAAGGFYVADYASWRGDRLLSLVIASSLGGCVDPGYVRTTAALTPKGFHDMPASFRELGPAYRAANPKGVEEWEALERRALVAGRVVQRMRNELTWPVLEGLGVRTMLLTGDADLYMPPPRAIEYASHVPDACVTIIAESGHSAYWEQPTAFNESVLAFLSAS